MSAYATEAPSAQAAIDLFRGEWVSRLPSPLRGGEAPLFDDPRVTWGIEELGPLTGARILELGPLEGGHTWMLERAGAASITAVEAHPKAYLRCLVVKEAVGMQRSRFLFGDFMRYLAETDEVYDVCWASGVLYHLRNPAELIELAARRAPRLFVWTHYYDPEIARSNEFLRKRISREVPATHAGFAHTQHRFDYGITFDLGRFCGGTAPHASWLTRDTLLDCLAHFGWQVVATGFEEPHHPHGPAIALACRRSP
jgi:hypothetical protein